MMTQDQSDDVFAVIEPALAGFTREAKRAKFDLALMRQRYLHAATQDLVAVAGSATPRSRVLAILAADQNAHKAAAGGVA